MINIGKILDNRLSNISAMLNNSPTSNNYQQYSINLLQQKINSDWPYASDVYVVQEEQTFGMMDWQDISVRINHVISDKNTSTKRDDDWRNIIFKDMSHIYALGIRYQFDNNIWITVQSDIYHKATASTIVRRCNNVLKWIDDNGVLRQEPCAIDYLMSFYRNLYSTSIATSQATIRVFCQANQFTNTIDQNRRFMFNGKVYKIEAIDNYQNKTTYGNDSPLLELFLIKDEINLAIDDVANNIANAKSNTYTISIDQATFNQTVGFTTTLTTTIKLNGVVATTQPVTWVSNNPLVGTISPSGVVNLLTVGAVTFTATMTNSPLITTSIVVNVASAPAVTSANIISPNVTSLLQGVSQTYSIFKYVNDVPNSDGFTIVASGANPLHYQLSVLDSNHFTVLNKGYDAVSLVITCTDNVDTTTNSISIKLKGVY